MGNRVQIAAVLMNLMINGFDAMRDVDGTRELAIKSQRGENEQLVMSVSDTGLGTPRQQADKIMRSLPRSLTALARDFGSAAPSSNRTAAACRLPITLRAAQAFTSPLPTKV
jgi:sensor histidine kinase regulating citrate/malate metabolism